MLETPFQPEVFDMRALILSTFAIVVVTIGSVANASIVESFDPAQGEFPEDVAPDRFGNLYVSLTGDLGEIRRVARDGEIETFSQLDPAPIASFGILGLATDHYGRVFAAVASFDPATHGVWQIDSNGDGSRIAGTENILMPNDLDFDRRGNLYVTDTIMGAVWRIGSDYRSGRSVDLWFQDALLQASGPLNPDVDLGANGIAIDGRDMYVAVTEGARVVHVEIEPDGSAGAAEVFAAHPDLFAVDGLEIDHRGQLYGALVGLRGQGLGRIVRIRSGRAPVPVLGPEDGLQFTTNLAFDPRGVGRRQVYVANWDVVAGDFGIEPAPAIHTFRLGPPRPGDDRIRPPRCFSIESLKPID
jgi:sugar lactone lactonase YvrE